MVRRVDSGWIKASSVGSACTNASICRVKSILPQRVLLVAGRCQQRIQTQPIMIVKIFVAQRHPVNPLRQQLLDRVIYKTTIPQIPKAIRQFQHQPQVVIHLAQQEYTPIAGKASAGKIGHNFSWTKVLKVQGLLTTVCFRRSGEWCFHLAE